MEQSIDRLLTKLYYTPGLPTAYSGIDRLFNAAKQQISYISRGDVETWLRYQDPYTLHKQARLKIRNQPKVYVPGIDSQWSADLCQMTNISKYNDNYGYILTVIDVFSKFAWALPVRRKTGLDTTNAFHNILQNTNRRPETVETDWGKEFWNNSFEQLCKQYAIKHFSTYSSVHCSVVERFNRSLKSLIYKHFTAQNTYRWTDVLPKMLDTYNNRWHRSIKEKPSNVSKENEKQVWDNLYGNRYLNENKIFKQGELVRISKKKGKFEKGYLPNYSEEVFKIHKVGHLRPTRYILHDLNDEPIKGTFVYDELQPISKTAESLWKIEHILSQRRNKRSGKIEYLVKWLHFPESFNSYVSEQDIVSLT